MQISWIFWALMAVSEGGAARRRRGARAVERVDKAVPQAGNPCDIAPEAPEIDVEGIERLGRGQTLREVVDARFDVSVEGGGERLQPAERPFHAELEPGARLQGVVAGGRQQRYERGPGVWAALAPP